MKKHLSIIFVFAVLTLFFPLFTSAQEEVAPITLPDNQYFKGRVVEIVNEFIDDDPYVPEIEQFTQEARVEILEGPDSGEVRTMFFAPGSLGDADHNLKSGETVILIQQTNLDGEKQYYIADRYRVDTVVLLIILFFVLVVIFAGWKGLRSLAGLAFTLIVIIWFILPKIIGGSDPFTVMMLGSLVIAVVSIYLGHGFNRRTTIAVVSTLITLALASLISILVIDWAQLFGLGTEEAFYVQAAGELGAINLKGLLLGGIIIGVLGVLDDITTAQAAVVEQLHLTNKQLTIRQLLQRGLAVGHEHIISLVNTLALAYVGASLPLLLLFTQGYTPIWVAVNSERIIEEVIRTLIGSSALVIAVPITTLLAAWVFSKYGSRAEAGEGGHAHHHH